MYLLYPYAFCSFFHSKCKNQLKYQYGVSLESYSEECLACTVFSKAITEQIGKTKSISLLQSQCFVVTDSCSNCALITIQAPKKVFLHSSPTA